MLLLVATKVPLLCAEGVPLRVQVPIDLIVFMIEAGQWVVEGVSAVEEVAMEVMKEV